MGGQRAGPTPEDVAFVQAALRQRGTARIPDNFVPTVKPYDPRSGQRRGQMPQRHMRNPQVTIRRAGGRAGAWDFPVCPRGAACCSSVSLL